jgi:hypothetical protein
MLTHLRIYLIRKFDALNYDRFCLIFLIFMSIHEFYEMNFIFKLLNTFLLRHDDVISF